MRKLASSVGTSTILAVVIVASSSSSSFAHSGSRDSQGATAPQGVIEVNWALPPFLLKNQSHEKVHSDSLKGKVWIANFIFTRCQGPCPLMTQKMALLQKKLAAYGDVRFISISVDPRHDTPPVLKQFAKKHSADLRSWHFLTGGIDAIERLATKGFKLPAGNTHSEKFVLVDRNLTIREFHSMQTPSFVATMVERVKVLRTQGVKPAG